MGFNYLVDVYERYTFDDGQIEDDAVRDKVFEIQRKLYEEFIPSGAPNEINIAFKNRAKLNDLMNKEEAVKTLDDCLHLFDGALMEVYMLLLSMYGYEFASFL